MATAVENLIDQLSLEPTLRIIENDNFKKLDQIIIHEDNILIVDWGVKCGVHILNKNLEYLQCIKFEETIAAAITVFRDGNVGILQNEKLSLYKKRLLEDNNLTYEKFRDIHIKKLRNNRNSLFGLCQDSADGVYFIEKISKTFGKFTNNYENFTSNRMVLPAYFKKAYSHDLKVFNDKLFINDYKFKLTQYDGYCGNDCIHVFDTNMIYLTSFGLNQVEQPKYLAFMYNNDNVMKIHVCEGKQKGSYKIFNENYKLEETVLLKDSEFPSYMCHFNEKLLWTQGNPDFPSNKLYCYLNYNLNSNKE
jgi:hypothetical protein